MVASPTSVSSTASNFNSLGSTIECDRRINAFDTDSSKPTSNYNVMNDMAIDASLDPTVAPKEERTPMAPEGKGQPAPEGDDTMLDQLEDMRLSLLATMERTSNQIKQLQGLSRLSHAQEVDVDMNNKALRSFQDLYKQVVRAEIARWDQVYQALTDPNTKRVAWSDFRELLLELSMQVSLWIDEGLDFEGIHQFYEELLSDLDKREIAAAQVCHDKKGGNLDFLEDELKDVGIMRLTRTLASQEACLELRFECISDLRASLMNTDSEFKVIEPGHPQYGRLLLLEDLIHDQLVTFHYLLAKEDSDKSQATKDRLMEWLVMEQESNACLLRLPNDLGDKLSELLKQLSEERAWSPDGQSDTLSVFVRDDDSLAPTKTPSSE